jgi:hypothetical protein
MNYPTCQSRLVCRYLLQIALALLGSLAISVSIRAAAPERCDAEPGQPLEDEQFRVGSIELRRLNVFNEEQAVSWPYRLANQFHVVTKDQLIRNQLLFKPGDVIDRTRLLESERWLRRNEYLSNAAIQVDGEQAQCNQQRNLIVTTQDQWSLTPHLSLASGAGETRLGLGITEKNLLGQGIALRIRRVENIDRDSNQFGISSEHIRGSRYAGRMWWSDSNDGDYRQASFGKPFYALDAARSWQLELSDRTWRQGRFSGGERLSERLVSSKSISVVSGHLLKATSIRAHRWFWGARVSREAKSEEVLLDELPQFGIERRQNLAFVGLQWMEDQFLSTSGVDLTGLPEDIRIGTNAWMYSGYAQGDGVASRPWWKLGAAMAPIGNQRELLELLISSEGFKGIDETPSEFDASISFRWLSKRGNGLAYQLKGELARSVQPFTGSERYLGSMSGLRGYEERLVAGATSTKWSIERRQMSSKEWFRVARLGWSFYADAGRVWDSRTASDLGERWLSSVGLGFRIVPTRAEKGKVLHIDFAVPLSQRDHPDVGGYEISVAIRDGL